jgi:hypothetical protein
MFQQFSQDNIIYYLKENIEEVSLNLIYEMWFLSAKVNHLNQSYLFVFEE